MTPDARPPSPQPGDSLDALRGYLLHLAEQHLDGNLQAKAGASDLVQAALLAAHAHRDQYHGRSEAHLKGWLRRILLNVIRKFRRHWRRQERDACREVRIADHPGLQLPDGKDTPSTHARRKEQQGRLAGAVALLTEEQRQAVAWRIDEGLSFADIGARLGKSADAARMLFHRALGRLQELLPDESAGGTDKS